VLRLSCLILPLLHHDLFPFTIAGGPFRLLSRSPAARPPRRRLRHSLIGTPDDTQHAIDRLHRLGYLERISWSRAIDIPENGVIIRPDSGDVLRYSQRDRLFRIQVAIV